MNVDECECVGGDRGGYAHKWLGCGWILAWMDGLVWDRSQRLDKPLEKNQRSWGRSRRTNLDWAAPNPEVDGWTLGYGCATLVS